MPDPAWRRSSHSNSTGGECVEVATNLPAAIPVRDSKDAHGRCITFTPTSWRTFLTTLKHR